MRSLFTLKGDLPPGVHPFPTLKGKRRFELIKAFNIVLGAYILIHKLLVPLVLFFGQTTRVHKLQHVGFWYLFHFILAFWLSRRTPKRAFAIIYTTWFAIGILPPMLLSSFMTQGHFAITWDTISGILTYGTSLFFSFFLLYRMRMPTTAHLFGLQERVIPKWGYAIPYYFIGLCVGITLVWKGWHV